MLTSRPRYRPFSQRLLLRLGVLAIVAMLLVSVSQVFLISRQVRDQQQELLKNLTATQIPLLQIALWDIERSEEHTSELRHVTISYAVFCLKKNRARGRRRRWTGRAPGRGR